MKKALVLMLSLIMLTGCATTRSEPMVTATPESAVTAPPRYSSITGNPDA